MANNSTASATLSRILVSRLSQEPELQEKQRRLIQKLNDATNSKQLDGSNDSANSAETPAPQGQSNS